MKLLDWKVDNMEKKADAWTIFYENLDTLFEECNQCGKCSSGCPAARVLALRPRKIALTGQRNRLDELIISDVIWLCAQCHQCMERCPREISPYEVIIYLQNLAVRRDKEYPRDLRIMYNAVRRISRIQDTQDILDREFEDYNREDLDLPELKGPFDMEKFQKAFIQILEVKE
jgi:heterodisulfide reductase subunit C